MKNIIITKHAKNIIPVSRLRRVKAEKIDKNILTLDAVVISYLWLKDNKKIKIDKNLYHFHRKRSDSVSFTEKAHYENAIEYLENKILDL